MTITVTPNQADIQSALRTFLLTLLPAGTEVVEGQDNRVPEPNSPNFVVMTTIRRPRLATNLDSYVDNFYLGSIADTTMTVSQIDQGEVKIGATVFGIDVAPNTTIASQLTGLPGGVGTYAITPSQALNSRLLASGEIQAMQSTDVVIQLDFHSPDVAVANDMAQIISTMFRDSYAVSAFAAIIDDVIPLYADDPIQVPFINGEMQYETRWIVNAHIQANQTVKGIPQQFADQVQTGIINVDAVYPPA